MKKPISVSPFIMLIIPVLLFLGLSLAVNNNDTTSSKEGSLNTTTLVNSSALVKAGQVSLIQYLMK